MQHQHCFFQLTQQINNYHTKLLQDHLFTIVTWSKCFFIIDEAKLYRSFVLQSQMKHTILSYCGILSLTDGSHVHELMTKFEKKLSK